VVGAGAFGTALALVARRAGREVTLWARAADRAAAIRAAGENRRDLPGVALPAVIEVSADPAALAGADALLLAVPAQALRQAAAALTGSLAPAVPVVSCAKGIEAGTGRLPAQILAETLVGHPAAALSGPGFAAEIARALPTAVTIAAADVGLADALSEALASETFRAYASDDLIGVEFGGAVKNVLAIACGVVAGRQLGESARAALIARGLAEMVRFGAALGGRAETLTGLSGLGDLVLTATSGQSRNARFGESLAQGRTVGDLLAAGEPLAEGAYSAPIAAELARRHAVDAPIIEAVAAIIAGRATVNEAVRGLVSRPLRRETG